MGKYIPINSENFEGNNILFSSDRILLRAKKDSLFLFGSKSISLNSDGTINIDSKSEFIVNSPKIYLGINSVNEKEPILLGDKTYKLLEKIINTLDSLSSDISNVISTPTGTNIPQLSIAGSKMKGKISTLRNMLSEIKSKKGFIE
jgi:hypothetical protein